VNVGAVGGNKCVQKRDLNQEKVEKKTQKNRLLNSSYIVRHFGFLLFPPAAPAATASVVVVVGGG
jgi:hypothetical protein